MYAAVYPTALVYTAEMVAFDERQREITNIMAATAISTAVAVVVSGAIASYASWRIAFVLPALGAIALAVALRRLEEPSERRSEGGSQQLRAVLGQRWALFVIAAAFPEGAALFGFLNYFAAALEAQGVSAALAGGTFAMYGVGVLCSIPILRRLSFRLSGAALIAIGGIGVIMSYSLLSLDQRVVAVVLASLASGWGFTVMHSTVQTWATEVAPEARGTAVSLFAASLFLGGGAGTALVAPLAGGDQFSLLFRVALGIAIPVIALLGVGRVIYRPHAASVARADAADSV
jgi:predicted MFS family arabinose efflux permease